jgi:hypothetical protein
LNTSRVRDIPALSEVKFYNICTEGGNRELNNDFEIGVAYKPDDSLRTLTGNF